MVRRNSNKTVKTETAGNYSTLVLFSSTLNARSVEWRNHQGTSSRYFLFLVTILDPRRTIWLTSLIRG